MVAIFGLLMVEVLWLGALELLWWGGGIIDGVQR